MQHARSPRRIHVLLTCVGGLAIAGSAACASHATRDGGIRSPSADRATSPAAFEEAFTADQAARISEVQPHVQRAAAAHDLDPQLINAIIWVESRFVADAKSPAGARGLMQLMPATAAGLAKQMGERRPRSYDPAFNVDAGSYYLRRLLDRFDGDLQLALAAYNAGAGNVNKWTSSGRGLPDFSRDYVAKVLEARARFQGTRLPAEVAPTPAAPVPAPTPTQVAEREVEPAPPSLPMEANGPEPEPYTPVFEPHPELDAHPAPAPTEPTPIESADSAQPAQPDLPDQAEPAEPDVGIGVLPGVGR